MGYAFVTGTPESVGIPSACILRFLDEIEREHIELNALLISRHDILVAEGYWTPHDAGLPHRLFSGGKAIIGLAVLIAIQEGYMNLEDSVLELLGEDGPKVRHPYWKDLTLYHMLTMHSGHGKDPFAQMLQSEDRIDTFFRIAPEYRPGTHFLYDNGVPDILGYLVLKKTGQNVFEYLRPRVFEPLEMDGMYAAEGPFGIEMPTMCASARSLMKLTRLFARKGNWEGRQILSRELAEMAVSYQVPSLQDAEPALAAYDTKFGYGFQIWRNSVGGFRIDGGRGQYGIHIPEMDLTIAVQSNEQDQSIIPVMLWKHITNSLFARPIPGCSEMQKQLQERLCGLTLALKGGQYRRGVCRVKLSVPQFGCAQFSLCAEETLRLSYEIDGVAEQIDCGKPGSGIWMPCRTKLHFPELCGNHKIGINMPTPGCDPTHVLTSCRILPDRIEVAFRSKGWLGGHVLTVMAVNGTLQAIWDTTYSYNLSARDDALIGAALRQLVMPGRQVSECETIENTLIN